LIEKLALQIAVAITACVPVLAGAAGAVNPAVLDLVSSSPQSLTHAAYLSGLLLGIGLAFWSCVPAIETKSSRFALLTAIVVLGGLARLLTAIRLGAWTPLVTGPLAMELIVTPAVCLWQKRVALSFPARNDHL
jgi:hypothetical protein